MIFVSTAGSLQRCPGKEKGRAIEASGLFVFVQNWDCQSIIEKLVGPVLAQNFYEFALCIENNDFLSSMRGIGVSGQEVGLFRNEAGNLVGAFPLCDEFWH